MKFLTRLPSNAVVVWVWFVNSLMLIFPDDDFSNRVTRPFILRHLLGIKVGKRTDVRGGSSFLNMNHMSIGDNCFINKACYFDLTGSIAIEDNVVLGHGVTVVTARHKVGSSQRRASEVQSAAVTIGRGSWIGCNVTILPGITIGRGVTIGAGAVVTKDIPDEALATGVPARFKFSRIKAGNAPDNFDSLLLT